MRLLARFLDIRQGEWSRVAGMFSLIGLIIATSYILKPVRSSLFLSKFGSERLPYVYILVAIVLGIVATGFARLAPRADVRRLFVGASLFFASNLLLFWLAMDATWMGFAFYVWVSIFTALMPSVFWLLANYVFYSNEGRRLFPVLMAGGILGSIVGGALTTGLVNVIGTPGLLLAAAALLVLIALVINSVAVKEKARMDERRYDISRQRARQRGLEQQSTYHRLAIGRLHDELLDKDPRALETFGAGRKLLAGRRATR